MDTNSSKYQDNSSVNAIVPLALLRTLQHLDRTDLVEFQEYAEQMAPKRLGMSATVSAQIRRYEELVKRGAVVRADEAVQLFRLVGRRKDAVLAFSQAGRVAAEEMLRRESAVARLVHRACQVVARRRVSVSLATRLAGSLLGASMTVDDTGQAVVVVNGPLTDAAPEGKPCEFLGAALAELLRQCTDFQGTLLHGTCRSRGDDVCSWHSGSGGIG